MAAAQYKFIDIGANLTDPMFDGNYGGNWKHESDRGQVLERAWAIGMKRIIMTVGSLVDCEPAFKIINKYENIYTTIGCHPTRCSEFLLGPDKYYNNLAEQIEENKGKVVAIGEIGLDYDRLHFCEAEVQKQFFERQLDLADKFWLPLFLHCRNAHDDFIQILSRNKDKIKGGVVHTFDGTLEQAKKLIDMGLYIGINGCSLKTEESLKVAAAIPNDKILIETDSPWCEIRKSHAGHKHVKTVFEFVKNKEKKKWQREILVQGRCEPVQIIQVLEVLSAIKNESPEKLSEIYYNNTIKLFFPKELEEPQE